MTEEECAALTAGDLVRFDKGFTHLYVKTGDVLPVHSVSMNAEYVACIVSDGLVPLGSRARWLDRRMLTVVRPALPSTLCDDILQTFL